MSDLTDRLEGLTPDQRRLLDVLLAEREFDLDVGTSATIPGHRPLSSTQERLWKTGALVGSPVFGNVPIALRIRGPLSAERLERAFLDVVARHEVLRSRFLTRDGVPVQVPGPAPAPALDVMDLTHVPASRVEAAATERLETLALEALDLERLPWRFEVLRVHADDHIVLIVLHHLVADGYGIRILFRELAEHYRGRTAGAPPKVPTLGLQVADLAEKGSGFAEGAETRVHFDALERALQGVRALTLGQASAPRRRDYATARVPLRLSSEETAGLRQLARGERVTLFMALVAAFQAALYLQFGEDEFAIGTIISHRPSLDAEKLVGNFGNNVFLPVSFADRPTFRELLARARDAVLDAHAHSALPLEKLVEVRRITLPRFNVMIVLRGSSLAANLDLPGLEIEPRALGSQMSPLDLQLDLTDDPGGLSGELEYRTAILTASAARSIVDHCTRVLDRVIADPDRQPYDGPDSRRVRQPDDDLPAASQGTPRGDAGLHTPTEQLVAGIWREVLGCEEVEVTDNFFDLGGHSLVALAVLERIQSATGHRLTVVDLAMQTLAQIGTQLDASERPT